MDVYFFIGKGLRGEISYTAKRCNEANNKSWKIIILQNCQNTKNTLIKTICMDEQWVDSFLVEDLSG